MLLSLYVHTTEDAARAVGLNLMRTQYLRILGMILNIIKDDISISFFASHLYEEKNSESNDDMCEDDI